MSTCVLRSACAVAGALVCAAAAAAAQAPSGGDADWRWRHTDAQWLFATYGDSTADPHDEQVIKPFKMLANGFALQLARGEDIEPSLETLRMVFAPLPPSAAMAMPDPARVQMRTAELLAAAPTAEPVPRQPSFDAATTERIRLIAEHYQLPYRLEPGEQQWWILPPAHDPVIDDMQRQALLADRLIWNWQWPLKPADVLWSNGASMNAFGHVALVETPSYQAAGLVPGMIDANTPGVVRHPDPNKWVNGYTEVQAYTPRMGWDGVTVYASHLWNDPQFCQDINKRQARCDAPSLVRAQITDFARAQLGKPYNWLFNHPERQDAYYCTSLLWQAYLGRGINLLVHQRPGAGRIIYPADIITSPALQRY